MINFIKSLFETQYGPYSLYSTESKKVPIMQLVEDTKYSEGFISDPMDVKSVFSGFYEDVETQVWVKYHKKTGLPKYEQVTVPKNN